MTRCEITELPVEMCSHCLTPQPTVGIATTRPRPGWTQARYRGQCAGCGELFAVGAHIRFDDETGGWIAECCEQDGAA